MIECRVKNRGEERERASESRAVREQSWCVTSGGRAALKEGGQRLIRKPGELQRGLGLRQKGEDSLTKPKINSSFPHNRQLAFRAPALAAVLGSIPAAMF